MRLKETLRNLPSAWSWYMERGDIPYQMVIYPAQPIKITHAREPVELIKETRHEFRVVIACDGSCGRRHENDCYDWELIK